MYAKDLRKYRVREALINSTDLQVAMLEFVDHRKIKVDIPGIQKMINRRRKKYAALPNHSYQIRAIVRDWNDTNPVYPISDSSVRDWVYVSRRLTLPAL